MTNPEPRDREQRTRDTLAKLAEPAVDVWVATAASAGSSADPYLVPLSLAWTARLALGPTRDVVVIDARLERSVSAAEAPDLAEQYARQADWDPRNAGDTYRYLVLRPERIQAWREANELRGRTLMRDGTWIT